MAPAELPVERNRFFTGKYMTARDFRDEQSYFLGRHRLHQWALHGWGIVAGLDVCPHPNPDCQEQGWLVITPGIAVDCYGRDIVLNDAVSVKIDQIFPDEIPCGREAEKGDWNDRLGLYESPRPPRPVQGGLPAEAGNNDDEKCRETDEENPANEEHDDSSKGTYLLGIRYGEVCVEPVPLLYDESNCGVRQTHNRIAEQPCIRYREYDNENECWLTEFKHDCEVKPCRCPCEDLSKAGEILKPDCPCGCTGFVPLARFRFVRDEKTGKITFRNGDLEFDGRRYLHGPLHPQTLTHICKVNWIHNGITKISDLEAAYMRDSEEMENAEQESRQQQPDQSAPDQKDTSEKPLSHRCEYIRLTIQLDDSLHHTMPDEEKGFGLYSSILQVHYEEPDGNREHCEIERIHVSGGNKLHCDLPKRNWIKRAQGSIPIHVTLNCNFLVDRKGRPVDGDHLRGMLPTGNGIEGGIFQSWFVIDLSAHEE